MSVLFKTQESYRFNGFVLEREKEMREKEREIIIKEGWDRDEREHQASIQIALR